ncbi:MAG: hypothetical protein ABW321_13685 [Polyangiales bacterium]
MSDMEQVQEPDTTELEQRAQRAREQLMSSIARLDQRAKSMVHRATDASLAGGLSVAAAFAFWLSMSVRPRQRVLSDGSGRVVLRQRPSILGIVLRTAGVAAGLVITGLCMRAAERHARNLADVGSPRVVH